MMPFDANGQAATGYVAVPPQGSGPGVLVLHAWWGLNDDFKGVCDRLAASGFVAFAPDLYGGKLAGTVDEAQALMKQSDSAAMSAIADGALDFLRQHPATTGAAVGALGFSMGAGWAYDLSVAAPDDVAAVVVFYGAGEADFSAARAAYLGHFVVGDEYEPDEYVVPLEEALRAANLNVTFYRYDGVKHWFMEPSRPEYNAPAAELAWQRTIEFLRKQLK